MRRWMVAAVAALLVVALGPGVWAKSENGKGKGQDKPPKNPPPEEPVEQPEPFEEVTAFATKTGARGVVAWQASTPVSPVVTWQAPGGEPQQLTVPDAPDTAGVAVIDGLEIGTTYEVTITDQLGGVTTEPVDLLAANAYNDYAPNGTARPADDVSWRENVYTIDLLVQLDSQSLPDDVPSDQGLGNIAATYNIVAERLYDALDGHARLGNVLVTDTQIAYAVNEPFGATNIAQQVFGIESCGADRNLADVLVETAPPFDSHTYHYAIEDPCTSYYIGRDGWLVVNAWMDDLDVGYTSTHELLHYAFGAPDLYPLAAGGVGCKNPAWDGSVMNNTGGWDGFRWQLTEIDRTPELTPCEEHAGWQDSTWNEARSRYTQLPTAASAVPILDMFNYKQRGNPDGGVLDIKVLDRTPGSSTLTDFTPDDTSDPAAPTCASRADLTRSSVADPRGDATYHLGSTGQPALNEPALDIVQVDATWIEGDGNAAVVSAADGIDVTWHIDDMSVPPATSPWTWVQYDFLVDGILHDAQARRVNGGADEVFTVDGETATGSFDVEAGKATVRIPATLADAEGNTLYSISAGSAVHPMGVTSWRNVVGADKASGGCEVVVPGTFVLTPAPPDAILTEGGAAHEWTDGPFYDVGETGPCDPLGPCDTVVVDLQPVDGSALTVAVDMDDQMLSYELTVEGPTGSPGHNATYSADQSVSVPVPAPGRYRITVNPWYSAGGTYSATATLADVATTTPVPDVTLADGHTFAADGVSPATNLEHTCTGPNDPLCITYVLDLRPADGAGTLALELTADIPLEDWDVVLYDVNGSEVTTIGLPATIAETGEAEVSTGLYYLVVQPYIAQEGSGFSVTAALS